MLILEEKKTAGLLSNVGTGPTDEQSQFKRRQIILNLKWSYRSTIRQKITWKSFLLFAKNRSSWRTQTAFKQRIAASSREYRPKAMLAQEVKTNYLPCTLSPCIAQCTGPAVVSRVQQEKENESCQACPRQLHLSSVFPPLSFTDISTSTYVVLSCCILTHTAIRGLTLNWPGRDHVLSARLNGKGQSTPSRETAAAGHGLMRPIRCELSDLAQCPARWVIAAELFSGVGKSNFRFVVCLSCNFSFV